MMSDERDIVIVLGAPNDAAGALSAIALARARRAIEEYRKRPGCNVLLGGGFGERFNTTSRPHAYYVAQHLIRNGVSGDDIVGFAEGSNTVEEAVLARRMLENHSVQRIYVITSDFHCQRAELIYKHVFAGYEVMVLGATARLSSAEEAERRRHEAEGLRRIREQGGVIIPPILDDGRGSHGT
ncbi:MAG: YdcF family protein [Phycisphaerales bacterium]|nr:MAG: YdcF family protein [Phycisphaerales bacterium]